MKGPETGPVRRKEMKDQKEAQAQGTGNEDPIMAARKGPKDGTEEHALDALVADDQEAEKSKDLKLRLVFKGAALDDLLKVFGAEVKDGEKAVSFVVPGTKGEKEVGDVIRLLFHKYAESGVTLRELAALIKK